MAEKVVALDELLAIQQDFPNLVVRNVQKIRGWFFNPFCNNATMQFRSILRRNPKHKCKRVQDYTKNGGKADK